MFISILIGFAIGCVLGAIIDLFLKVNEFLTSFVARRKVQEKLTEALGKLQVELKRCDREYGDVIDLMAYNQSGDHIANITIAYEKGTTLSVGQSF